MHRVYVHEGDVWTLASVYARRKGHTLCPDDEYVVIETAQSASYQEVCMLTDDGRLLCDIGPEHIHDAKPFEEGPETWMARKARLRAIDGD